MVIYAEGRGGYLATQALSAAMSVDFPDASEVLAAWASGLELKQLAATLGISRHSSARRLKRLRGRMGEALLDELRGSAEASAALAAFIANGGAAEPNVRIVVERLAPLSAVELGVLCAVLLRRRKGETLSRLGIGHAWYHVVKARVEAMFQLSGPHAKRSENVTIQAGLRFGIIEAMTKSTKSLAVAALAIAGAMAAPLRSEAALDSITPPTVQS